MLKLAVLEKAVFVGLLWAMVGCAGPPPEQADVQPVPEVPSPCTAQALESLLAEIEQSPVDVRGGQVEAFVALCRKELPLVTHLLEAATKPVVINVEAPVKLPQSNTGASDAFDIKIRLVVTTTGASVNGKPIEGTDPRKHSAQERSKAFADTLMLYGAVDSALPVLIIRAEQDVPFEEIVMVLDAAREVGLKDHVLEVPEQ